MDKRGGKRIEDGPPFNLNYASLITYGSFDPPWENSSFISIIFLNNFGEI